MIDGLLLEAVYPKYWAENTQIVPQKHTRMAIHNVLTQIICTQWKQLIVKLIAQASIIKTQELNVRVGRMGKVHLYHKH